MPREKRSPSGNGLGEKQSKVPRHDNRSFSRSSSQTWNPSSQTLGPSSSSQHYSATPPSSLGHAVRYQPRPSLYSAPPPSSLGHAVRYQPEPSWLEEDVGDDVPDPNVGDDDLAASFELYGTLDNKIVGVRYYGGVVNPGERVILCREPSNQYDRNAVRVDNVMRNQIGHLPAVLVSKLAPYIDNHEIVLEGVLTGQKEAFHCPVRLSFYGPSDPSTRLNLEARLKDDKLLKAKQLKATRQAAEAQKNVAMRLKCNASTVGLGTTDDKQQDLLQDLVADSEAVQFRGDLPSIDVFAMNEDALSKMPKAQQPESIQSELLPYQLQGLAWMISKETPLLPAPGSKDVVQLWKRDNRDNFLNIVSSHTTATPPKLVSGGVLADDMGLGKTLQVISLIMASGFDAGPTLIVSPVGVMSNWEQQIQRHVKKDHLPRVFRYHKAGSYTKNDLLKHNIVITTYDKLRTDYLKNGPLLSVQWRRVVLDEAHAIRNYATGRAKAAFQLQAKSSWMLTGTPIINAPKDFLSALKFLKMTGGIEEASIFLNLIDRPLTGGGGSDSSSHTTAKQLFQSLTQDLCLRRRKDMKFVDLKLPPKTEYVHRIKFREEEKVKYDTLMSETTEMLELYRRRKGGAGHGGGPQVHFTSVLEKLLRLRQLCCHWTLCGGQAKNVLKPLEGEKLVKFTPENLKILQQALLTATNEGEECPICTDALGLHTPVITACKHRFGQACIMKALERDTRCPMCRQPLAADSIVGIEPVTETNDDFDGDTHSSKTEALEKILRAKLKDPKSKVVIFSQWTSFLAIIAKLLDEMEYKYCRLEGWMTIARRDQSIDALTNDPSTRIMLASLGASGVGLNLVAADTVILVDSWWAPAIEDQAVDRVHRLGQTRETTVWKLVMDDSIEERVLGIQDKKRELVNLAFQDKARDKKETSRLDDVLELLS